MNQELTAKICLGTAQFGLDYGIANKRGQIPFEEAERTIDYALKQGIAAFDTAHAYGQSEDVLGRILSDYVQKVQIISKLPKLKEGHPREVEHFYEETIKRLRQKKLYGYLIHSFEDFKNYPEIWPCLQAMKKNRLIEKIGFSLYKPDDLEVLFDMDVAFDLVQIPFSVFDQRFEDHLGFLKSKNIEVHARSIFLQGLVFLDPERLPSHLKNAKPFIKRLNQLSKDMGLSINSVCLNFVVGHPLVDRAVVGIDGFDQLERNVRSIESDWDSEGLYQTFKELAIQDERILLPYLWHQK